MKSFTLLLLAIGYCIQAESYTDRPPEVQNIPVNSGSAQHIKVGLFGTIAGSIFALIKIVMKSFSTALYRLFSMSLTLTLSFTTVIFILIAIACIISMIVRYRVMTVYARLPAELKRTESRIEIFPNNPAGDNKPGLSNYLDEFLSAIKIFGYLERPVFHELTRTMRTRKLFAGETLLLEEEKGFCLVVDGLVQIFVKSQNDDASGQDCSSDDADDDCPETRGHNQKYQLLTEVKSGAPLSSLFSILSLFTEEVKLKYQESMTSSVGSFRERKESKSTGDDFEQLTDTSVSEHQTACGGGLSSDMYLKTPSHPLSSFHYMTGSQCESRPSSVDPFKMNIGFDYSRKVSQRNRESIHPDILARSVVNTTIAIIPVSAFRRLTHLYPKSTGQIIQVIITRFNRVTLATAHGYLKLTNEFIKSERAMSRFISFGLPDYLLDAPLVRLKDKFKAERDRIKPDDAVRGIALHNPREGRKHKSTSSIKRGIVAHPRFTSDHSCLLKSRRTSRRAISSDNDGVCTNAGDLIVSYMSSPFMLSQPFHTSHNIRLSSSSRENRGVTSQGVLHIVNEDIENESQHFREAILFCIYKALGLGEASPSQSVSTGESAPRLVSYDHKRKKAVFNNFSSSIETTEPSSFEIESESVGSQFGTALSMEPFLFPMEELIDDVEIIFYPANAVLVEQGKRNPGLFYVIDGILEVSVAEEPNNVDLSVRLGTSYDSLLPSPNALRSKSGSRLSKMAFHRDGNSILDPSNGSKPYKWRRNSFLIKPGGIAGYVGTVSDHRSFVEVTAKTNVYVGFLPRKSVERIAEKYPIVLLTLAKRLTWIIPKLILHIDFALEWMQASAGQIIFKQNEESDAIYIVLNGRLRALRESETGEVSILGEFAQGDSIGELEALTDNARPGSLHAIRDGELARFPITLFNSLAFEHPEISITISKVIAQRMRALMDDINKVRGAAVVHTNPSSTINLRTISIIPVASGVPVVEFASRLTNALMQVGTPNGVASLQLATILQHLGRHAFSKMGTLKLAQYLADLEEKFGVVLYIADTSVQSPWTQTCISKADCILLVGLAEASPGIGEYERFLLTTKTTAVKELVLLHPTNYCPVGLTRKWLENRPWINGLHHHIHMNFNTPVEPAIPRARRFGSALKHHVQALQEHISKYASRRFQNRPLYSTTAAFKSDFHRLARHLRGKSIGLVLGGGGARGIAHIGVLQAFEEAGIPIDIVGGTSIGALIGGLYAWDGDVIPTLVKAKKFSYRMNSVWRFLLDLTYPTASYTTGHEFNRGIFKTFGNAQIEDFWIPFYCNSTNISKSRPEIHTSGYAWRYVRASMSLAGLLPPICDYGNMLLDGGYIDNLTVAHMKRLGADVIFAVDVGSVDDSTPQTYGDSLSGAWAVLNRWNPFTAVPNPPTLSEIQSRLAYVSSVDALERAKNTQGCHYMRPETDHFGTLEFGSFDAIRAVGYTYARNFVERLRQDMTLPVLLNHDGDKWQQRRTAGRRASI